MQPTTHRVGHPSLAAALVLGLVALLAIPAALAEYTGRPGLVLTGKVAEGYDSELVQDEAGLCGTYTAAVTGDVSAVATASVLTLNTARRMTVSVGGLATVATATLTVVPCHGHLDELGNIIWIPAAAVTLTARSDVLHGTDYGMPKQFADTDGCAYVKLVPVAITGGGTVKIYARI